MEEQLRFPSGTATAQLISVLHKMPPTSPATRPPRGYSPLNAQDDEAHPPPVIAGDSQNPESKTTELVRNEAWISLMWSFLVSSVLTVITLTLVNKY